MKYYSIIFILLIIVLLLYINYFNNISENFDNNINLTDDEKKIIKELSPHILAIKNLSDLANNLMKDGSLTVPGGLKVNGNLKVPSGMMISGSSDLEKLKVSNEALLNKLKVSDEAVLDKLKIGKTYLRQDDDWIRLCSDYNNYNNSYNIGLAAQNIYAHDDMRINGIGSIKNAINELKKNTEYLMTNAIRKDKPYAIQSSRGGHLSDRGGWGPAPADSTWLETMYFKEVSFNKGKY